MPNLVIIDFAIAVACLMSWDAPVAAPETFPHLTLALYCAQGAVSADGVAAQAGQLLLCREGETLPVELKSETGAALMAAAIYHK